MGEETQWSSSCKSVSNWYPIVSTKCRSTLDTTHEEDTLKLIELLNAYGQMEITKLTEALLEIFFEHTQKEIQNTIKYLNSILQRHSSELQSQLHYVMVIRGK
jgi:hypothetical protein